MTNLKAVERSSFEVNKNIENISKYQNIKLQAVAASWADTPWFSGLIYTWQLHTASPLRSATYINKHAGVNQIATRLLRHCIGPRCCKASAINNNAQALRAPAGLGRIL